MPSREFRKFHGKHGKYTPYTETLNPTIQVNKDVKRYVTAATASGATESWASKLELPSSSEVMGIDGDGDGDGDDSDVVHLVPNNIHSPWDSPKQYLEAHYNLLREDSVAPLRDAVAYVRQQPQMKDTPDLCIYEKVHTIGITFAQSGVAIRVQFSTERAGKKVVWDYSKRLTSGTIVALSPANDVFNSKCVVAVVAARPLDGLKVYPPQVDLFFTCAEDAEFDYQQEWIMVESRSGYYEATRHTMAALQKLSKESFPLSTHICGLDPNIGTPEYRITKPIIKMASVLEDESCPEKVDIREAWPPHPASLDASQWEAFRQILTKKLSIIQGPPGTGKTHVSVIALKALLANMSAKDPPIVIAAQTNHALDQLLGHVAKFEPNYVRLGGRSNDLEIKKQTLFEVRQRTNIPILAGGALGPARKELRELIDKTSELLAPFALENSGATLPESLFLELGLITEAQHDSIIKGSEGWVSAGDQADPISAWLGDELVKFDLLYKPETFGFDEEEIDLEYEQLKEWEAEHGLDDDDIENLRGQYMSLKEGFTTRAGHHVSYKFAQDKYLKYDDMWKIPVKSRGATYRALQLRAKEAVRDSLRKLLVQYNKTCLNLKIGKWEKDSVILQDARIIGMTTTGLSKYRALVSSIKPKIFLVEEAAEVIEAPVTAACVESLEHLVLVGDHQQLQGTCALKDFEGEPFYLNVSMFERLVRNNIPFKRMTCQRRMAPEIRKILMPIYDDLRDHPSVLDRPSVPGMGSVNSYFFCHDWPESSDSLLSKYNQNEAKMVLGFYIYLHMNGVPVEQITILTFYNGQRKKILKAIREHPLFQGQYAKVVTVDSYQGEENEIVLLSLVRSNEHDNIGFLSIENRVCVALSRARRGFYIFGNAESLAVSSGLWWDVIQIMRDSPKRLGYYLPLTCSNHHSTTPAHDTEIWSKLDGGCTRKCETVLSCGHKCPFNCHTISHSNIQCKKQCDKTLACGHKCAEICFRRCSCPCSKEGLPSTATGAEFQPTRKGQEKEQASILLHAEKHTDLVQRYNDFAAGGVKQDDLRLADEARRQAQKQQLEHMDDVASRALFGEVSPKPIPTTSKLVPDGDGGFRTEYTQEFPALVAKSGNLGFGLSDSLI